MEERVLGKRLKELRVNKQISLVKLSETVGISTSNLADYENDAKNPTIDRLRRIAEFYGVSLDYIAGTTDVKDIDLSTRAICDATGLSEDAVTVLQKMQHQLMSPDPKFKNESEKKMYLSTKWTYADAQKILSAFICHENAWDSLSYLVAYVHPGGDRNWGLLELDFLMNRESLFPGSFVEDFRKTILPELALRKFQRIIDDIKKAAEARHGNDERA